MQRVFKYPVEMADTFSLDMPKGADVLTVQTQAGMPQLWALVDDTMPTETRTFVLAGTGQAPIIHVGRHVGSFQMAGGRLVWHLFEAVDRRVTRAQT